MTDPQPSDHFLGLVASLQASAWVLLGKVVNPMSGKIERDLSRAKDTIDLLGALEEKTRGNLHVDEARFLGHILYELRMNYVEELAAPAASGPAPTPPLPTDPPADTPTAPDEHPHPWSG
jgi:hypothetical protein